VSPGSDGCSGEESLGSVEMGHEGSYCCRAKQLMGDKSIADNAKISIAIPMYPIHRRCMQIVCKIYIDFVNRQNRYQFL